eukprot:TRINITY_DN1967_c0_g1_i1.p1 TRINITY_DN1967_c0_g1~~TRINITY_DN1967_c0_g1_i1.p1  ORF type:complete len:353 (+),score=39.44 TRINITY_DN1967_c0_g1_i1:105-1163(+)
MRAVDSTVRNVEPTPTPPTPRPQQRENIQREDTSCGWTFFKIGVFCSMIAIWIAIVPVPYKTQLHDHLSACKSALLTNGTRVGLHECVIHCTSFIKEAAHNVVLRNNSMEFLKVTALAGLPLCVYTPTLTRIVGYFVIAVIYLNRLPFIPFVSSSSPFSASSSPLGSSSSWIVDALFSFSYATMSSGHLIWLFLSNTLFAAAAFFILRFITSFDLGGVIYSFLRQMFAVVVSAAFIFLFLRSINPAIWNGPLAFLSSSSVSDHDRCVFELQCGVLVFALSAIYWFFPYPPFSTVCVCGLDRILAYLLQFAGFGLVVRVLSIESFLHDDQANSIWSPLYFVFNVLGDVFRHFH